MEAIKQSLVDAFIASGIDPALAVVARSDRPDIADFQCNGAFLAARQLKQDPRKLAEAVVSNITSADATFEVAGPGYINLKLQPAMLERLLVDHDCPHHTMSGRIMIDFGGPNIAKPMHVGHLRSLVIGDSLQRMLRFVGYEVISDIHLGDWGLQMGLLLAALEGTPDNEVTLERLEIEYPLASGRAKNDDQFKALAQSYTQRLQAGDPDLIVRWKNFVRLSLESVDQDIAKLGVVFTMYNGESNSQPFIPTVIQDFKDKGLAEESDGALVVRVSDPPLILQKSDGAALYATTDLATIVDRMDTYAPDKIIYVTDERQQLHFKQVFAAAEKIGYVEPNQVEHIWFGTVNGPDGRPLKTRAGGVPKLHDLLEEAYQKALEKNPDPEIAQMVAVSALKFADLQNPRATSYSFDLDKFLSFEGKTGPYLLYQVVRIKSMLAKAGEQGPMVITDEAERILAFKLVVGFGIAFRDAIRKLSPKEIADHAYDVAQTFSKFYATHQIAGNPSRVSLAALTLAELEVCLELLGMPSPDRM